MALQPLPVMVRQVWQSNLAQEIELIQKAATEFRFIAINTEFPGTVFNMDVPKDVIPSLSPAQHYMNMKKNVDALNIIQLGLTLSDAHGNLPRFGSDFQHVWQFNFRDFDAERDLHDPKSIALLRSQGIDFSRNRVCGIYSTAFNWIFRHSELGSGSMGRVAWVTFHGLYDFGFLIKILTRRPLPDDLEGFMALVRRFFGTRVYDLKPIARALGLHGGLEKVAKRLGLDRAAWKNYQAGSDSFLTMQAFFGLVMNRSDASSMLLRFNYMVYGLTC